MSKRWKSVAKESKEKSLERLTVAQREFIELVRICRKDPVKFSEEMLDIRLHEGQMLWLWMTTKTQTEKACDLGIKMDKWKTKEEFYSLKERNPDMLRNILVPSNRWGKTLVTSVKHLWYNYYKVGVKGNPENIGARTCGTLNLSPHSNQCDAGYQYIVDILNSKFVYTLDGKSFKNNCKIGAFFDHEEKIKRKIHFVNHTSYRAVPTGEDQASSLAGTPYLYISYDECAQSMHLKEELPAKIMSRLIDFGGPLDLVSTPEVDRPSHQYFFHIAKLGLKGEDGWWTLIGKIADNVFLGVKEMEQQLASIKQTDPAKYRQVAFGEFISTGNKMFDNLVVERMWDRLSMENPLLDHKYLITADWGFADTGDPTVFYVLDYTFYKEPYIAGRPKIRIVYHEEIKGGSPFAVLARARMLQREWNGGEFIHDSSALGGLMIKKMLKEMEMSNVIDFNSSGNKAEMLFALLSCLTARRQTTITEDGKMIEKFADFGDIRSYHIPALESQMGNYAFNPDKGVSDKKLTQDHIMALGQAVWHLAKKFNTLSKIKDLKFNPLAPTIDKVFNTGIRDGNSIKIKEILIPENRIY